jgi:hypothetical protein
MMIAPSPGAGASIMAASMLGNAPMASGGVAGSAAPNYRVSARSGRMRGSFAFTPEQAEMAELGYGGAELFGQSMSLATSRMMSSGSHAMEGADLTASAISMGAGALGMALGGPLAGLAAAGLTNAAVSPLIRYMTAPQAQREEAFQTLSPFYGAFYGKQSGYNILGFTGVGGADMGGNAPGSFRPMGSLSGLTSQVNARYAGSDITISSADVAASYGSVAGGIYAGGGDPFATVGVGGLGNRRYPDTGARQWLQGDYAHQGHMSLIEGLVRTGISALSGSRSQAYETAAYAITRRLGQFTDVREGAKSVAPIYGTLPETGGNTADILLQYGAQDTATYLRSTNDDLALPDGLTAMSLSRSSATIRSAQRNARMRSRSARGSAAGTMSALGDELLGIAGIPGGTDSAAYADTMASYRDAGAAAFEQANIVRNEIPLAKLNTTRNILSVMPFAPSSWMVNNLQTIHAQSAQLHDLLRYENARRASGQLSEAEELSLTQREGAARMGIASGISDLTSDYSNRLPGMSAGRPSFGLRTNSLNMAASAVNMAGGYTTMFGSVNGAQRQHQNSLYSDLGFTPGELAPHSRSGGINSQVDTSRMESLLAAILSQMQRGGSMDSGAGRGGRPGSTSPNGGTSNGSDFPPYSTWRN